MKIEDYNKYYIQGSDHYLIPKDVFKELFNEMMNWKEETEKIKQKLNWIAFGDDPELALRYLRKIGYVDFDEERKVYINKHNNEPFLLEDEQEKGYYIKDEELNEYTEQLEYQVKSLKEQLEEYKDKINWYENFEVNKTIDKLRLKHNTQQKGFIKWLEDIIDSYKYSNIDDYKNVLQKYKEIIGSDINVGSIGGKE